MRHGFSLLELSIVLVIIGLLAGGVMTGQSLIKAAELRSVSTQYTQFITAANAFRDKYQAVPGDMKNATQFWGVAHATPATCKTTIGTGTQTCDGDGNGRVSSATGSSEMFRAWQHLANAGLIEGSFPGVGAGTYYTQADETTVPKGRYSNSLWYIYQTSSFGNSVIFNGDYGNALSIAAFVTNGSPSNPIMTAQDSWNIDQKLDDGMPGLGKVYIYASGGLNLCTTVSAPTDGATANYLLTATAQSCSLYFKNAF